MGLNISNQPADGTWVATIGLPDSGTTVTVEGSVNPGGIDGLADTAMTGSPLTAPTAPGSGSIFWIIEANTTTGALDVQQNTTGFGNFVNTAGCVTIFAQTLVPGNTDESQNSTDVTSDQ